MRPPEGVQPMSLGDSVMNDPTAELARRVEELEREVERCQVQLQVRGDVIRRLRGELQSASARYDRVVSSRMWRTARRLRSVVARPSAILHGVRKRRSGSS
jgi:hypothetical protein